jgi:hypothetical protein
LRERVHTVTDYYDGPRGGISDYLGRPHAYACIFDETAEEYSDQFLLMEIDQRTLALASEDWEIWLRWREAFDGKKATLETHPALPEDRARHEAIVAELGDRLKPTWGRSLIRVGEFVWQGGRVLDGFEVEWRVPAEPAVNA